MEFKFRAIDDRPPTFFPPPPPNVTENVSFFTEHALRVGYPTSTEFRRNEVFQNPIEMREAVQWELEKERIREEIIAGEIARKRMLEAEVRREMMIEREMAMRRADGFPIYPAAATPSSAASAMRFDSRFPMLPPLQQVECGGGSVEERIGRMLENRFGGKSIIEERIPREFGNFSFRMSSPFQRTLEGAQIQEVKSLPEANKEKLILLAKPDPTLSGTKRKAVTPPALGSSGPSASSKKPKEEWSCALCQVSATSERALDEHLQGRKHKTKEAGLIAQKVGKNFGTAPLPRKHSKHTKPAATAGTSISEEGVKLEGELLQVKKIEGTNDPTTKIAEAPEKKKDQPPMQKNPKAKKKNGVEVGLPKNVKKFKFWCEICQIGAHALVVMTTHKQGKKHMARVQELGKKGGTVPPLTILPLPESAQKANDAGVAKEANKTTNENADTVLEGLASSAVVEGLASSFVAS